MKLPYINHPKLSFLAGIASDFKRYNQHELHGIAIAPLRQATLENIDKVRQEIRPILASSPDPQAAYLVEKIDELWEFTLGELGTEQLELNIQLFTWGKNAQPYPKNLNKAQTRSLDKWIKAGWTYEGYSCRGRAHQFRKILPWGNGTLTQSFSCSLNRTGYVEHVSDAVLYIFDMEGECKRERNLELHEVLTKTHVCAIWGVSVNHPKANRRSRPENIPLPLPPIYTT